MNWTQFREETDMNTTTKGCSAAETDSTQVKIIKTLLLSIVMIFALAGNMFIIGTVIKKKNMRKTTNFFIANMAASDMFIAAVVIPRILTELHVGQFRWLLDGVLGAISCKFCFFLTDFSICISILSHAVIAFDRFWAIVYSLRPSPITPARRKYIMAVIWLFSFCIHSPTLYSRRLKRMNGTTTCHNNWSPLDSVSSQKIYFGVIFVNVLCIPILIITVLYSWLVASLMFKKSPSEQPLAIRQRRRKEDIKVFRKVIILLIVFLACLTPITVFALLVFYSWGTRTPCDKWFYAFTFHLIFLSNSAINPCLCIALSESYRSCVKTVLRGFTRKLTTHRLTQHTTLTVHQDGIEPTLETIQESAVYKELTLMLTQGENQRFNEDENRLSKQENENRLSKGEFF